MAIAYATVTGRITRPDSDIGRRVRIVATPQTEGARLAWPLEDRLSVGPAEAWTDAAGAFTIRIPLGGGTALWGFAEEPLDGGTRTAGAVYEVTADADYEELVNIRPLLVTPDTPSVLELDDLADVESVVATDGQALVFDAAAGVWRAGTVSGGTGGTGTVTSVEGIAPDATGNVDLPDPAPAPTWDTLAGKPATFAPTIGTTATTALAGDTAIPATAADVGARPDTYTPSVADLPSRSVLAVHESAGVWPARPSPRADLTVYYHAETSTSTQPTDFIDGSDYLVVPT